MTMKFPSEVTAALDKARASSAAQPGLVLSQALALDRHLDKLGWLDPLTFSGHGVVVPGMLVDCGGLDVFGGSADAGRALFAVAPRGREGVTPNILARCFFEARGDEIAALNLAYANQCVAVESLWLHFLNKYLAYFSPRNSPRRYALAVQRGAGSRLERLVASTPLPADSGNLPRVTVLMPVFNAAATLDFAVRSIVSQTWQNWELILIDDASTDASLQLCQAWAERDSRIRVLRLRQNGGPYIAKNVGLTVATGAYVTVHDADDWAFPSRIADQMFPLLSDAGGCLKVTMGRTLRMTESGLFTRFQPVNWVTRDGAMRWCFPSPMFERIFFEEKIGAWDSVRVGADTEIVQRIRRFMPDRLLVMDVPVMLQLDAENTLTRQPETHNDERGEAPIRTAYRHAWAGWHAMHKSMPLLKFPQRSRVFPIPAGLQAHHYDVKALLGE